MDIPKPQTRKKLFIVDDSKMMRKIIADIFADDELIEVVGEAGDGEEALQILPQVKADVVTLDVQMPVMDGLTTLKHMMIQTPVPTVMLSAFTQEGADVTFDALKYGAVDFVSKPSNVNDTDLREQAREVARKVHLAVGVELKAARYIRLTPKKRHQLAPSMIDCRTIVAIGAAEGGYGALLKIIPHLSSELHTAYLVVLYASPRHVDAFVKYLNQYSEIEVKRAASGEPVEGGVCYLASGEEYLTVQQDNGVNVLHVCPAPFASQKGSINMLMFSVAEMMKDSSMGVVLTGLGNDGVEGMAEILRVGGKALVQDPRGCLYRTMPEAALAEFDNASRIADTKIAATINKLLTGA